MARVLEVAERVAEGEPHEISFADTVGVGVPWQVSEIIEGARQRLPGVRLRAHFHNTRNTGLANAYAAVQAGVNALDCSVGGIGGCPFAPGAKGNVATEDLVHLFEGCGFDTGIDLDRLRDAVRVTESATGLSLGGKIISWMDSRT